MKKKIDKTELAVLCDARDKLCDFCESDGCSGCIVTRLINDAYNECEDEEDDASEE